MFPNKYPGRCLICRAPVAEGRGFCVRRNGRFTTLCASSACIERAGESASSNGKGGRRTLDASGRITMPYDASALTILRSMPGARFDRESKQWIVSIEAADIERTLELADRLKLEVAEELRSVASEGTAESKAAEERASREELYEFQRAGVRLLALKDRVLLADDMGLGKTVQALVALPENARAVVVCPASVKRNWADETERWRSDLRATVLSGRNSWRAPEDGEIVILNWDILPEPTKVDVPEGTILIADEAHMAKNGKAKRSKRISGLGKKCAKTWFLTGTPLLNKPFDLMGTLKSGGMFEEVFGSFTKFVNLFGGYRNQWNGWEFTGPTEEVPERLRRVMLRRLKSEVLPDLPSKRYQTISINGLGKALSKELDEQLEQYRELLEQGILPRFEEMSAVRAKLAAARIPALIELVEGYEEAETPLLVFSAHRAPVEEIGKREGWATILGGTPNEERAEIVRRFQAGDLKGVALTIRAGGLGLTLTRASEAIFVDRDWTPALNIQAEDRMVRIGQTASSVLIKLLVTDHPLDRRVSELLEAKIALIRRAIEEAAEYKVEESSEIPEIKEETQAELDARLEAAAAKADRIYYTDKIHGVINRERMKGVGPEPELTVEKKDLIREAFDLMLGQCDGALTRDDVGFNKPDAAIAHWVARVGLSDEDEMSYRLLERILSRYKHTQLGESFAEIWR